MLNYTNFTKGHLVNKKQSQSGSAHLVIIILLAVALLGALGYVYYLNFMQPKVADITPAPLVIDNPAPAVIAPSKVALTEVASIPKGLAIKYPSGWTIKNVDDPGTNETTDMPATYRTVSSKDGGVSIMLKQFASSGRGVPCSGEVRNVSIVDTGVISGYPTAKFVSYTDQGETFIGAYGLADIDGKTDCQSYDLGQYLFGYTSVDLVTLQATVTGDMTTDNYKIAKRIIQSLYVKN